MYSLYRAWLIRDAVTAAGLATPPDIVILVGNENEQFLAHRQLVSLHSGYLKSLLYDTTTTTISVPNVLPEAFGPLLTFMYTGYLHLDESNIYSILLGTHLLHMPRALELCREYLMQRTSTLPPPPNIVKPIPSRKAITLEQPIWTPTALQSPILLRPTPHGPFQSVASQNPAPQPLETAATEPIAITTTVTSATSSPTFTFLKGLRKSKKINDENKESALDVACCDGPVQFYRVLNECYNESDSPKCRDEPSTSAPDSAKTENPHLHSKNLIQLRKALEKNAESDTEFTCTYCNHIFKSHFCYEKHVRRHINHVDRARPTTENPVRRQVRQLDMNVQYYPCKTCGSKFPSYYFVHKHRKLCHASEEDQSINHSQNSGSESGGKESDVVT